LKVAELAALDSDYYKAVEIFEKVASSALSNNLMKWSLKEYFLKSGMCLLALGDMVDTNRALKKYTDMDPTFPSTREYQLLVDLTEAISTGDSDTFENKIFHEFDQLGRLDTWKTAILTRIKKDIETQGEDFS
jgi:alpha-soluble NSF attachment protein